MVARNGSRNGKDQHTAILITKQQASGLAKIDPLMAAFNAVALMSTNPWSSRPRIFVI
jgi:phage terminase large subunit-like protein